MKNTKIILKAFLVLGMFLTSKNVFSQTTCGAITINSDAGPNQTGCVGYPYTATLNGSGSCTGTGCSGVASYAWYQSNNCTGTVKSTNATYMPTVSTSTTYSLKVCFNSVTCFTCTPCVCDAVVVSANCTCCRESSLDINVDEVFDKSINIFPNPSGGLIKISFMEAKNDISIVVFNSAGQSVIEKTLDAVQKQEIEFNLLSFGKGYYFIQVMSGDQKALFKRVLIK
jgi:type IX secretion system substrate protein